MQRFFLAAVKIALLVLLVPIGLAQTPPGGPYKVLKTVKVGGDGSFDYVYADVAGRRVYIPRGSTPPHMTVFDLDTLAPAGDIPIPPARGAAVDPKSGHGFASSKPVVMWDTKTLKEIKRIDVQGNPDGIMFDPFNDRVWVFSHAMPHATIINAADGAIVGTLDLGGQPEQAVTDSKGHIYDQILAESERTSRLIDDLLLLARSDAEGEEFALEPMDLAQSLREACEQGRVLAGAAGLSFATAIGPACPVLGDPQALRRLFLILLDNAAKYTPRGGMVRVTMDVRPVDAVIEVQDTGVGIGAEDLPHLFERFYRVGKDRSRSRGGVGLGLSIAQRIATGHGGDISVHSEPGAGATFRVRLPTVL